MAKIKIDLNQPLMDFSDDADAVDGMKPVAKDTLAKTLAQMLKTAQEGDCLKHLNWALDLWNGKTIEVDDSDFSYIKDFVQKNKMAWALARGQIIKVLDAAHEAVKNPKKEGK